MGIETRQRRTSRLGFTAGWIASPILLALSISAGCGDSDRGAVRGKLTRKDGSPLVGAKVIATSPETGKSAHAQTDAKGEFILGGNEKGDGVSPSSYAIVIQESRGETEVRPPASIAKKYESPSTSGLSFTVKAGETIQLDLTLDPP
jgi:hypothetical protein